MEIILEIARILGRITWYFFPKKWRGVIEAGSDAEVYMGAIVLIILIMVGIFALKVL